MLDPHKIKDGRSFYAQPSTITTQKNKTNFIHIAQGQLLTKYQSAQDVYGHGRMLTGTVMMLCDECITSQVTGTDYQYICTQVLEFNGKDMHQEYGVPIYVGLMYNADKNQLRVAHLGTMSRIAIYMSAICGHTKSEVCREIIAITSTKTTRRLRYADTGNDSHFLGDGLNGVDYTQMVKPYNMPRGTYDSLAPSMHDLGRLVVYTYRSNVSSFGRIHSQSKVQIQKVHTAIVNGEQHTPPPDKPVYIITYGTTHGTYTVDVCCRDRAVGIYCALTGAYEQDAYNMLYGLDMRIPYDIENDKDKGVKLHEIQNEAVTGFYA